jgi:hypothetical protein
MHAATEAALAVGPGSGALRRSSRMEKAAPSLVAPNWLPGGRAVSAVAFPFHPTAGLEPLPAPDRAAGIGIRC